MAVPAAGVDMIELQQAASATITAAIAVGGAAMIRMGVF